MMMSMIRQRGEDRLHARWFSRVIYRNISGQIREYKKGPILGQPTASNW